jgi:hypothetical protein
VGRTPPCQYDVGRVSARCRPVGGRRQRRDALEADLADLERLGEALHLVSAVSEPREALPGRRILDPLDSDSIEELPRHEQLPWARQVAQPGCDVRQSLETDLCRTEVAADSGSIVSFGVTDRQRALDRVPGSVEDQEDATVKDELAAMVVRHHLSTAATPPSAGRAAAGFAILGIGWVEVFQAQHGTGIGSEHLYLATPTGPGGANRRTTKLAAKS